MNHMSYKYPIAVAILLLIFFSSCLGQSHVGFAAQTIQPNGKNLKVGSMLKVSQNGRYLVRSNGKPFFWLGDTAWLLFQMTTREDAELYLSTRARQGFSVIQAAIVMGE